jgi:GntR family transcriptional regulator
MAQAPRLNKYSPVPLYQQLVHTLVARIESNELAPGDRIPSERELAESMNVSRTTARLAIDELVDSGLVYREQGRGTYVAEARMRGLLGFASFTEDMRSRGLIPRSRVLHQGFGDVSARLAKTLRLNPGERALHLLRLRLADDRPLALQSSYLPERLVPGLEEVDLTDLSLFTVLRERYFVYPTWTEAEIEARKATADEVSLLKMDAGVPVLVVRGLTYTDSFEVVESVQTVYHGQGLALYIGRQRFANLLSGAI